MPFGPYSRTCHVAQQVTALGGAWQAGAVLLWDAPAAVPSPGHCHTVASCPHSQRRNAALPTYCAPYPSSSLSSHALLGLGWVCSCFPGELEQR